MDKIRLHIKGLSYSQTQSGAYALVLGEGGGQRTLPIIIGGFEAQSIAIALEKEVNPPRPLTHDLFKNFADHFRIKIKEVVIHKLKDGVFFSLVVCDDGNKEQVLDARTSDAVALAVRFGAPIFTYPEILQKAGVILKEGGIPKAGGGARNVPVQKSSTPASTNLKSQTMDSLNRMLDKAVKNEDYELAARVRDEISRRSAN